MHEFAPSKSRPSGNCPSDVELAAYVDGVLGKEDATRVTKHLVSCESCYEVYSETVHFQLESEPDTAGEVVPFPSNRWLLAAAAAMLVLLVGGWYVAPPPQIVVAKIAPDLEGRPAQDLLWDYTRHRGGGASDSEYARQSFQVGALLVDFHLSAQAGAATDGSEIWRKVGVVVGEAPGMGDISQRILSEANQISPEVNPTGSLEALRSVSAWAAKGETELEQSLVYPEYFDFGKWTEAGRVAARMQDSSFFTNFQNHRFLSYALETWQPDKPEQVRERLEAIKEIWGWWGAPDPKAYKALEEHFQAILDQYDFRP